MALLVVIMIVIMIFATYVGIREDNGAKKKKFYVMKINLNDFDFGRNDENNRLFQEQMIRNNERIMNEFQQMNDLNNMGRF